MRQKTKRDWSAYNKCLVKRGDLFLWFDEETLSNWYSAPDCNKQGRPYTYSDVAIQTPLSIREVFHRKRSLAETAMFQIKQIFGDKLKARNFRSQVVETRIKSYNTQSSCRY